ncbi:85/88 kDa calcium-independent phospholipase A2-like [Diadema setosum]|uniref:85/88 kDa calcium-independent phospholipase A2-like n=1 Tax=Diadema setosum TaxID=31175 RepID=UPI003B39FF8E
MAFKNPFSADSAMSLVFNSVMSSIPHTESYMWTVRREKPQKYAAMAVIAHADLMRVYRDEKSKIFECVLHPPVETTEVHSLFRLTSEDDALARFIVLHQYLQPFFNITPRLHDIATLQKLSDLSRNSNDFSPAHLAVLAKLNDAFMGPEILKHINSQKCVGGKTPLLQAIECGSKESVEQLLKCEASIDIVDSKGENVYHYVARLPRYGNVIMEILPKRKDLLDRPNQSGQTALLLACQLARFDVAVGMVKAGAAVDMTDKVGYPIHYALKQSHLDTAQAILDNHRHHGKVPCSKHGGTPLHWAKSSDFIKLVLEQDHDINAMSKTKDTALNIMIKRNRPMCALMLVTSGADPNIPDSNGNMPLHHAVKNKDLQVLHLLLSFGADVNVVNHKGESPRHWAATDILNTIGGMMGINSEVIYTLHEFGAERCKPGTKGCQGGCKHGGQYNGMAPKNDVDQIDAGAKVYDKYLTECVNETCSSVPTQRRPLPSGVDAPDSVAMETDGLPDLSCHRSKDTVLCLDGGGIKGLILTQLLAAIEKASGRKITEMFDWIVGTSTGGILAIALSQGYSVEECRKLYMGLKDEVFVGGRPYNSEKLEQFLRDAFGADTPIDKFKYPRIMVSGTLGDRSPPALHLFRNYEAPETSSAWIAANQPPFQPVLKSSEQLAWRAARSSGAAPTYFRPMGRFLDGGLISNNPTLDALTEIQEFYMYKKSQGEEARQVGLVVSLGTGLVPLKPISHVEIVRPNSAVDLIGAAKSLAGGANLVDIMVEQVCDSRMRSVDRARAWCHSIGAPFFRLSPPLSADISMDETRDHMLLKMMYDTQLYIQKNKDKIAQLANVANSL